MSGHWASPSGNDPEPNPPVEPPGQPFAAPTPPQYGAPQFGPPAWSSPELQPAASRGKGPLVVAGLVVGALVLAMFGLAAVGLALAGKHGPDGRPDGSDVAATGPSAAPTRVDPLDLRTGDCLLSEDLPERIDDVPVVPCTQAHDAEMSGTVTLPAAPWPGDDEVDELSDDACRPVFESYVGIPYDDSDLDYSFITPRKETWESGDRLVICLVTTTDGTVSTPMAGSSA